MLSVGVLQATLTKVRYWPGWRFTIFEHEFEGPYIRIEATVPDARHLGETTDLGISSPLPPFESDDQFVRWLLWRLDRIATHEVREGLWYEGQLVADPHGNDGPWETRARSG